MTMDDFANMQGAIQDAQHDDTPFISTTEDEIHIFGDPNKTEIKSADYTVLFGFPDNEEWRKKIKSVDDKIVKEIQGYIIVERVYKNVYISPRRASSALTAMTLIMQFLHEITEDGEFKPLSYDQMLSVFTTLYREIEDAVYELVGVVLNLSPNEWEWMMPINTVENAVKIVLNNPSIVNQADLFFGSSLGDQ